MLLIVWIIVFVAGVWGVHKLTRNKFNIIDSLCTPIILATIATVIVSSGIQSYRNMTLPVSVSINNLDTSYTGRLVSVCAYPSMDGTYFDAKPFSEERSSVAFTSSLPGEFSPYPYRVTGVYRDGNVTVESIEHIPSATNSLYGFVCNGDYEYKIDDVFSIIYDELNAESPTFKMVDYAPTTEVLEFAGEADGGENLKELMTDIVVFMKKYNDACVSKDASEYVSMNETANELYNKFWAWLINANDLSQY